MKELTTNEIANDSRIND